MGFHEKERSYFFTDLYRIFNRKKIEIFEILGNSKHVIDTQEVVLCTVEGLWCVSPFVLSFGIVTDDLR